MFPFFDVFSSSEGSGVDTVQIDGLDIATIVLYFVLVLGIGVYSMFGVSTGTEEGYFLAGRFMTWIPVGASLFATNIGSEHYVGLTGSGAEAGLSIAAFELNALFLLPLVGWVFVPVYMASGANTLPEYMTKRYGGQRIRMVLSVISVVMYIFTKNSVDMYSGALFIQQAIGWNIYLSVFLLLAMTVLSTIAGGLAAVIYTDTLQCFIMILGALVVFVTGIMEIGGFEAMVWKYPRALSDSSIDMLLNGTVPDCGLPPKDGLSLLREPDDIHVPWPGFVFGQTTSSLWYWCADQMMVQRVLAAKDLSHAQAGCLFCGVIKLLPLFVLVMPGLVSRIMFPNDIACNTAEACEAICESPYSCSNIAYPKLVLSLMPNGLRGFIIAVLLSATMSDLSSTFNSSSTLFTMDLYKHIRKSASMKELMIVGRVGVVAVVAIGVAMIPLVMQAQGDQLFVYIQSITNYFSPPIAAVYVLAIIWPRGNERGAFWSLTLMFVMGFVKMMLDFFYPPPECGQTDDAPWVVRDFHYMYYALFSFWLTIVVNVIVSLFGDPVEEGKLIRTVFQTRHVRTLRPDEQLTEEEIEDAKRRALEPKYEVVVEDKKELEAGEEEPKKSLSQKISDFLCGAEQDEDFSAILPEDKLDMMRQMTTISQTKRAKWGLFVMAVVLMTLGTFQYIFFSVKWETEREPDYYAFLDH
ncbi:hypothetical protein CAPTEDRAFT_177168 [Capitella teleta]|uniref:Sodium/myo-inositol cotransporter n=1 Tax=Capitella teleta TaxID=283909 RepID=R7UBP7_CAPTE|nr:hypothetical protein CAPTEDRAFT_177168 [Capitella teleta]|eukprot:ELU01228.1 hypothetical protein CAPTEDRAFT_177168 [Capitella teleta]